MLQNLHKIQGLDQFELLKVVHAFANYGLDTVESAVFQILRYTCVLRLQKLYATLN